MAKVKATDKKATAIKSKGKGKSKDKAKGKGKGKAKHNGKGNAKGNNKSGGPNEEPTVAAYGLNGERTVEVAHDPCRDYEKVFNLSLDDQQLLLQQMIAYYNDAKFRSLSPTRVLSDPLMREFVQLEKYQTKSAFGVSTSFPGQKKSLAHFSLKSEHIGHGQSMWVLKYVAGLAAPWLT
jgi:hypothetical protein